MTKNMYLDVALRAQLQLLDDLKNLKVSHNDYASVVVAYAAFIHQREKELKAALKLRTDKA